MPGNGGSRLHAGCSTWPRRTFCIAIWRLQTFCWRLQMHLAPCPVPEEVSGDLSHPIYFGLLYFYKTISRGHWWGAPSFRRGLHQCIVELSNNRILTTSQHVNEIFLYSTVSTLNPIVGMVVTTSPATSKPNDAVGVKCTPSYVWVNQLMQWG